MSKQIIVDELDFDNIKANIKTFLMGQDVLKDYNFEGSALSVLIDVLAYNTHYNSLYTNFVANEMFLDSASKYSSAVSLAKTIGYTPTSYRSAKAVLNITVTLPDNETPASATLPRGTTFISPMGNVSYTFSTLTDYSAPRIGGTYTFNNVAIYEGTAQTRSYTANDASQFVIPHQKGDTSTLQVLVRDTSSSSVVTAFTYADDLLRVKADDATYFLKQREDLFYEVYFGNGYIGRAISTGNIVTLNYLASSGSVANGAKFFTYFGGFRPEVTYAVSVVATATGGSEAETIESIKFNAPKAYTAQNRAVTVSDYETLIYNKFPNIQSVKVWGGQDHIPKTYGKVFVCAKPVGKEYLNNDEKNAILDVLNSRKVMTMIPEFVAPDFIRIEVSTSVYYNSALARKSVGEMQTRVTNAINDYANTLNIFESSFRFSALSKKIDATDNSIVSNITTLRCRQPIQPKFRSVSTYSSYYGNPIFAKTNGGTFYSTRFYEIDVTDRCYLIDDGAGKILLMSESITNVATKVRETGTIDYATGTVEIANLNIIGLHDSELEFVFYPSSNDIIPVRQFIVTIPSKYTKVTMISDNLANGDNKANSNHIFTASR
jgi:hypothetical protein